MDVVRLKLDFFMFRFFFRLFSFVCVRLEWFRKLRRYMMIRNGRSWLLIFLMSVLCFFWCYFSDCCLKYDMRVWLVLFWSVLVVLILVVDWFLVVVVFGFLFIFVNVIREKRYWMIGVLIVGVLKVGYLE